MRPRCNANKEPNQVSIAMHTSKTLMQTKKTCHEVKSEQGYNMSNTQSLHSAYQLNHMLQTRFKAHQVLQHYNIIIHTQQHWAFIAGMVVVRALSHYLLYWVHEVAFGKIQGHNLQQIGNNNHCRTTALTVPQE